MIISNSGNLSLFPRLERRKKTATGTISDDKAFSVIVGDTDIAIQSCPPTIVVAGELKNTSLPAMLVQIDGGRGIIWIAGSRTQHNKSQKTGLHSRRSARDAISAPAASAPHAASLTTDCPSASARDAPPLSQRIANRIASNKNVACGPWTRADADADLIVI